ncbi:MULTISPECIES: transcription antitermination factor NusB [unclassified Campylobacter]|uniref:transcription antitermination factor NusB n=1 Tax=unclassified Campylobacter TaxID=2593542 RepID=UPI001237B21B|nr:MULTISPECIES: transcription antitermination factor NusB [unclassified Campylobacter]KAA6226451.1 transcription antitermination factor NusB [Campylobacter sp. LR185c]KAA6228587.1 transcription antitermination factor NusB [Campylobacter sp. LR196d]KAA6229140.1 transcription antitermination factor NusB [Campylobacter sp. LR286c]KAA6233931.1 transcription antitermination factor NusB [Campylobacter sp. LR291e]KAA6234170.1 transcription antitermination factor NusB [Campylobacter sp. LR264d]
MATRHQARQSIISLLYALEFNEKNENFIAEFLEEKKIRNEQKKFSLALYEGICANLQRLDELINSQLKENEVSKLGYIERAILRLGAYEMFYTQTSRAVIINEAIELAKEMANDSTPKFVNGVLDSLKSLAK